MEKNTTIDLPITLSELEKFLVFTTLSVLSFFIPFTLGNPQWLVGTLVNASLFLSAVFLPKRFYISLAILPSLGVLARGLIFGPLTPFLIYFLPFIWLGNLILILLFKFIYSSVLKNIGIAVVGASVGKFLLLFLFANIYFKLSVVPALFLQTMGLLQLSTALAGGLIALIFLKIYGKFNTRG